MTVATRSQLPIWPAVWAVGLVGLLVGGAAGLTVAWVVWKPSGDVGGKATVANAPDTYDGLVAIYGPPVARICPSQTVDLFLWFPDEQPASAIAAEVEANFRKKVLSVDRRPLTEDELNQAARLNCASPDAVASHLSQKKAEIAELRRTMDNTPSSADLLKLERKAKLDAAERGLAEWQDMTAKQHRLFGERAVRLGVFPLKG